MEERQLISDLFGVRLITCLQLMVLRYLQEVKHKHLPLLHLELQEKLIKLIHRLMKEKKDFIYTTTSLLSQQVKLDL